MISHNQCKRELKTLSGKETWLNNYPQINAYKLKLQYFAFEPYFFWSCGYEAANKIQQVFVQI